MLAAKLLPVFLVMFAITTSVEVRGNMKAEIALHDYLSYHSLFKENRTLPAITKCTLQNCKQQAVQKRIAESETNNTDDELKNLELAKEYKKRIDSCEASVKNCQKDLEECEKQNNPTTESDVSAQNITDESGPCNNTEQLESCMLEKESLAKRIAELEENLNKSSVAEIKSESKENIMKWFESNSNLMARRQAQTNIIELDGRQYLFVTKQSANWFEASSYCDLIGMKLVSIETKEENDLILQQLEKLGVEIDFIYTGGNRIGQDYFTWSTGKGLTFEDWARNQPDNFFGKEMCMVFWHKQWHDLSCQEKARFICEQI